MMCVVWENINFLEISNILSMAEDGYEFQVNDGRVASVLYPMEEAA